MQAALEGRSPKKGRPVLAYAVALAAALSVESPFMHVDNITVSCTCFAPNFSCLLMYRPDPCCHVSFVMMLL